MVRAIGICALAGALLACGTPVDRRDGGGDAGGGDGGGPGVDGGGAGLVFELVASPPLGEVVGGVTVEDVRLTLRDVRAIGDSAPGDSRTSTALLTLDWEDGRDPPPLAFPLAPPGIYSSFEARLGPPASGDERFRIEGEVRVGETVRRFRIENEDAGEAIGVALDGLVVAGGAPRTATIAVSFAFLADLPWAELGGTGDEEIRIESGDPHMPQIVSGLAAAFSLAGSR